MKKHRFKIGDHVSSRRMLYTHHGIYLGNNEVIHYAGFASAMCKGTIEVTTLEEFSQGAPAKVVRHTVRRWNAQQTIERAYGRLGEDWYNLLLNNCEHFVNWCIDGAHRSPQVERANFTLSTLAYLSLKRKAPQLLIRMTTRYGMATVAGPITTTSVSTLASSSLTYTLAPALAKACTSGAISASAVGTFSYGSAAAIAGVAGLTAPVSIPAAIVVGGVVGLGTLIYSLWD